MTTLFSLLDGLPYILKYGGSASALLAGPPLLNMLFFRFSLIYQPKCWLTGSFRKSKINMNSFS